jgi:serine/threonine protein kinase
VNILKRLKHENIISLLDHKQTSHNLYLVFEYCEFTDLNSFIKKQHGGILPEEQVKEIMYKIK